MTTLSQVQKSIQLMNRTKLTNKTTKLRGLCGEDPLI